MSTEAPVRDEQAQEPVLVVRTFAAEIGANTKERIIEGVVLPYNKPCIVGDHDGSPTYSEEWAPGVFRANMNAANRVLLDIEHYGAMPDIIGSMGSIQGTVGHGLSLQDKPEHLYGAFRVLKHPDGDKALELAEAGVLSAFSVAAKFLPTGSLRTKSGTVRRINARLDRVSLCRAGAFEDARVMAIRSEQILDAEDYEQPIDPELALRMAALGLALPDRYKPATDEGTSDTDS